jgi:hypothetical protein
VKEFPILMQKVQLSLQGFEKIYGHIALAQVQYDHQHNEEVEYFEADVEDTDPHGDSNGNHHVEDRLSTEVTTGSAIVAPPSTVAHPSTVDAITRNAENTAGILSYLSNTS